MCLVQDSVSKGRMVKPINCMQTGAFKFSVDFLYWKEGVMRGFTWKRYISDSPKLVIIRKKATLSFIFILLKHSRLNKHFASPAVAEDQWFSKCKKGLLRTFLFVYSSEDMPRSVSVVRQALKCQYHKAMYGQKLLERHVWIQYEYRVELLPVLNSSLSLLKGIAIKWKSASQGQGLSLGEKRECV